MSGPLQGLKILEISATGPVALFGWILADLGATVLRVDRPAHLVGRKEGTHVENRAVIERDLKRPEDIAFILDLVRAADVLVEGYRPGVMERLGLGPDVCHVVNPKLVYGRCTGWGQDGCLAQEPGHDINYLALTGALAAIGTTAEPVVPLNLVADYGGGAMLLAVGVISAVLAAQRSGCGQVVDAAMVDGVGLLTSVIYQLANRGDWHNARAANVLDGAAPYYRCYRCSDEKFVAVGALEMKFRAALGRVLGMEALADPASSDPKRWPAIAAEMSTRFLSASRDEWVARMANHETCCTPVLDMLEAPFHPHNQQRNAFLKTGSGWVPAPAPRLSATPVARSQPPDTASVLAGFGVFH